jgi:hypothetical protein
MAGRKNKKSSEKKLKGLRNKTRNPIVGVRVMQINSAISVSFVPMTTTSTGVTQSSVTTDDTDTEQPALQITSPTFTALVQEAAAYPEVRSEVVAAYAAQVASGHYPPVDVISGLANLLSGVSD